jgi:hypothetical protein
MKEVLLDEIRKLSDDRIRGLTNLQAGEDIEILRTAILRRAEKWIATGVLEADAPWEEAWNLFRACLEIHRAANDQTKSGFPPPTRVLKSVNLHRRRKSPTGKEPRSSRK